MKAGKPALIILAITIQAALQTILPLQRPSAQASCQPEPVALSLRTARRRALRHAREWQFQQREAALARKQLRLGRRQTFPRVSFTLSHRDQVTIGDGDSRLRSLQFSLSQPLYDGGRREIQKDTRRLQQGLREGQLEKQRTQILYAIEELYFQISALVDQVVLLEDISGITADQLQVAEKEAELGLLRRADLNKMQIKQLEAALDLNRKRETVLQKKAELRDRLCLETDRPLILTTPPPDVPGTAQDYPSDQDLERRALSQSPVLRQARRTRREAAAQVQLAGRRLRPSITGKLSAGLNGEDYPLTDPALDISLSIALPSGSFPAELTLGAGSPGDQRRTRSLSLEVPLLSDLSGPLQTEKCRLALAQAVQGERDAREEILRRIPRLRRGYQILLSRREILDRQLKRQDQRIRVLLTQLLQGQVTRLAYMESLMTRTDLQLRRRKLLLEQNRHLRQVKQFCGIPPEEALP